MVLLNTKDIAKRLGYQEEYMKRRILYREGLADYARKISGKLRWTEEDYQKWLDSRKVEEIFLSRRNK